MWKRAFAALPGWPWKKSRADSPASRDDHLGLARESLRELVQDKRLPEGVPVEVEFELQ